MKPKEFPGNGNGMIVEFHRTRTGPNFFVGYYKNRSQVYLDPKQCWRMLGTAKFTDIGKALKEWCVETYNECLPKPEIDMDQVKSEGFGPEAHVDEVDPTANTKMIV